MSQSDPVITALMAPGAPFEVVASGDIRVFKHAPENMGAVFNQARLYGEAEFIVSGERRLTFNHVFTMADVLSSWLRRDFGVTAGQSVAICMQNCPEWMIAFIAIINAGGVAVLANSRGTGAEMAQALHDTDTVLVIGDGKRLEKLEEVGYKGATLFTGEIPQPPADYRPENFEPIYAKPEDMAAMFFTSGTTGRAKAAALSHRALVTGMMNTQMAMTAVLQKMAAAYGMDVATLRGQMPQGSTLLIFPLFHTSGCTSMFLTSLLSGGKLVLMDRWNAEDALDLIEDEKISSIGGVPTMYWDLLRSPKFHDHDLSSLKAISCGGQALPLNLLEEIRKAFPEAYIGAGYGMTETSGAIAQSVGEAFIANPKASGQILPMVDVQITDEDGQALPVGEVGEVWAKGATLMDGYYGNPEATASAMSNGWLKTGDIGRIDDDGYIYIVDRKTDMVISGGENIYCAEVEQILGQHPAITQLTTFGVPDDRLGERLVAAMVVTGGISASEIEAFAKENLAAYKLPSEYLMQAIPFELNAMGKIEKHKVRDAYLNQKAAS